MHASVWERLGIGATDDARAIRKAYSARLKEIDPDSDPQAFIALREARDAALEGRASGISAPTPSSAPRPVTRPEPEPEPRPETADRADVPPPRPRLRSPWQIPTVEEHLARLSAMLFDPGPKSVDGAALTKEANALLRHPDLALVTRAEQVEEWLAQAIVNAIPRSDALLAPAIAHYGWEEKAKGWNCSWYIEAAVARARDCRFRDSLAREHGPALGILAEPPPARTNVLIAWAVAELLEHIRDEYPSLERDFDPDTIAWWDEQIEARRERFAFRWLQRLACQ